MRRVYRSDVYPMWARRCGDRSLTICFEYLRSPRPATAGSTVCVAEGRGVDPHSVKSHPLSRRVAAPAAYLPQRAPESEGAVSLRRDLNPRPPHYECGALPAELRSVGRAPPKDCGGVPKSVAIGSADGNRTRVPRIESPSAWPSQHGAIDEDAGVTAASGRKHHRCPAERARPEGLEPSHTRFGDGRSAAELRTHFPVHGPSAGLYRCAGQVTCSFRETQQGPRTQV